MRNAGSNPLVEDSSYDLGFTQRGMLDRARGAEARP
jgi:hypothetical protein